MTSGPDHRNFAQNTHDVRRVSAYGRAMARCRVMIVDDHPLMGGALKRTLAALPAFDVAMLAPTEAEAMEMMTSRPPEIVLVHLALIAAAATLLAALRIRFPGVRTLVMVDEGQGAAALERLAPEADGFLTSRATEQEVIEAVEVVRNGGAVLPPALARQMLDAYASPGGPLAARDERVLALAVDGLTDNEIAEKLGLSRRTVQRILAQLRQRAGVRRRPDLVRWATSRGEHA